MLGKRSWFMNGNKWQKNCTFPADNQLRYLVDLASTGCVLSAMLNRPILCPHLEMILYFDGSWIVNCIVVLPLNNACWVFNHFETIYDNLKACASIDICRLLFQQLQYLAKSLSWFPMKEKNCKAK